MTDPSPAEHKERMSRSQRTRVLNRISRVRGEKRYGNRFSAKRELDLLAWAATLPDEDILEWRNIGPGALRWIREHQPPGVGVADLKWEIIRGAVFEQFGVDLAKTPYSLDAHAAAWEHAMSDPAFIAGMQAGRADFAAGRTVPYANIRPLHLAAGENLSRCGVPVGDICPDCEDPDGK